MVSFSKTLSLRWSDLDPNFHLRHSVYYDFGAQQRIEILEGHGMNTKLMHELHFGPILFREECVFKKEIRLSDTVILTAKLANARPDGSRWSIVHEFLSAQGRPFAILTV